MSSRFLLNDAIWQELRERVPSAKRVCAAVAYLGKGAGELLPLRRGDVLLVDLSLASMRSGRTDPREVTKYFKRGVQVFSRGSLHAKFFTIDDVLIAGSANMSRHSRDSLDEAAVLTNDVAAVTRARGAFGRLCTQLVGKEYLAECCKQYRPPRRPAGPGRREQAKEPEKLWILGGLTYIDPSEEEEQTLQELADALPRQSNDTEETERHWLRYPSAYKFFERLQLGDQVIACTRYSRGYDVSAPSQYLGRETYRDSNDKKRFALVFERQIGASEIRWTEFTKRMRVVAPTLLRAAPRTIPITDASIVDAVLRQWTPRGKFRKRPA